MSAIAATSLQQASPKDLPEPVLCCLECSGELTDGTMNARVTEDEAVCERCNWTMRRIDGVWRAIHPTRAGVLTGPLSSYEFVRKAEGRWSNGSEFYCSLPWKDTTKKFSEQWRIRAFSYRCLMRTILPLCMIEMKEERLRIIDIGAGNCWMSYRLSSMGHRPVAVDLSVSCLDGLGAARHYWSVLDRTFPLFQAEMDRLPFIDEQFDLAIFNSSFHYSADYESTLRETLRVLRPNGAIVIVDSPTYRTEEDGETMKRERSQEFASKYGGDGTGMGGQMYLTPERLERLKRTGICWKRFSPWRGWRWAARPFVARVAGRRRPSEFHIYLGTRASWQKETQ